MRTSTNMHQIKSSCFYKKIFRKMTNAVKEENSMLLFQPGLTRLGSWHLKYHRPKNFTDPSFSMHNLVRCPQQSFVANLQTSPLGLHKHITKKYYVILPKTIEWKEVNSTLFKQVQPKWRRSFRKKNRLSSEQEEIFSDYKSLLIFFLSSILLPFIFKDTVE